jgi:hypothetical protein
MVPAAVNGRRWWLQKYAAATEPSSYGDNTTYARGFAFLEDCETVEDWGCGTGYARKFRAGRSYTGVDGSALGWADRIADLRTYTSSADGIFIRHVLEHNHDWQLILANAVASARSRLVLIIFTPFQDETRRIGGVEDIPDLGFRKEDLLGCLAGFAVTEEHLVTATQYGQEHVFYAARLAGCSGRAGRAGT